MKKYILLALLFLTTAINGQNNLLFFFDDNVVDTTPPDSVENLLAVGGVGSITLTWNAVTDVYKYYIYAGTSANPTSLLDSVSAGTETWDTTGLVGGTVNHFRVKAGDASWNLSSYSESKSDTVLPVIPVLTVVGNVNKITITHAGIIADSLRIYRGTSANPTTWVYSIAANSTKIDSPLTSGTVYHYRAKALTGSTLSDYSTSVNDTAEYTLLAENYEDRVVADGGSVMSMDSLESFYNLLTINNYVDSLTAWWGADFGIKLSGSEVIKWYDVIGNYDLVESYPGANPLYYVDSLDGQPTVYSAGSLKNNSLTIAVSGAYYIVNRSNILDNKSIIGSSIADAGLIIKLRTTGEVWGRIGDGGATANAGIGSGAEVAIYSDYIYTMIWGGGYFDRQINTNVIQSGSSAIDPTGSHYINIGAEVDGTSETYPSHYAVVGIGKNTIRKQFLIDYLNSKYSIY